MDYMQSIADMVAGAPMWLQAFIGLMFAAKIITVMTPTKVDDKYFGVASGFINGVLKALNYQALNVGKDKNADDMVKK